MLTWAVAFLMIAIIAALFEFSGIAAGAASAAGIAKALFFFFLIALAVSLAVYYARRRR